MIDTINRVLVILMRMSRQQCSKGYGTEQMRQMSGIRFDLLKRVVFLELPEGISESSNSLENELKRKIIFESKSRDLVRVDSFNGNRVGEEEKSCYAGVLFRYTYLEMQEASKKEFLWAALLLPYIYKASKSMEFNTRELNKLLTAYPISTGSLQAMKQEMKRMEINAQRQRLREYFHNNMQEAEEVCQDSMDKESIMESAMEGLSTALGLVKGRVKGK